MDEPDQKPNDDADEGREAPRDEVSKAEPRFRGFLLPADASAEDVMKALEELARER